MAPAKVVTIILLVLCGSLNVSSFEQVSAFRTHTSGTHSSFRYTANLKAFSGLIVDGLLQSAEHVASEMTSESEQLLVEAYEEVKEAAIPQDVDSVVALACAESACDVIGGLLSYNLAGIMPFRLPSNSVQGHAPTSSSPKGALFGTVSVVRSCFLLLGIPDPLDIFLASIVAELLKQYSASQVQQKKQIDYTSSIAGVSKWMVYDKLMHSVGIGHGYVTNAEHYFMFGMAASCVAFFIKHFIAKSSEMKISSMIGSNIYGGMTFLFFEEIRNVLKATVPSAINTELPMDRLIEGFEHVVTTAFCMN